MTNAVHPINDEAVTATVSSPKSLVSYEEARRFRFENSPNTVDPVKPGAGGPDPVPRKYRFTENLSGLGPGIMLYFETIKFLSIIMFICFIISIPSLLVMVGSAPSSVVKTNSVVEGLKVLTFATLFDNTSIDASHGCIGDMCHVCYSSIGKCASLKADVMSVVLSGLDCVYTIVFLLAVAIFRKVQDKRGEEAETNETTAADFTVEVRGLPKDVDKPEEVLAFFSNEWSKVAAVVLACADGTVIQKYRDLNAMGRKLKRLEARHEKRGTDPANDKEVKKIKSQMEKMEARIVKLKSGSKGNTSVAYVTFEHQLTQQRWIYDYAHRPFCGFPREKKFRHKHTLAIKRAPEPTDIQWQNLSYGRVSRFFRKIVSLVLSFVMLLFAVVIVVAAKNFKQQQAEDAAQCTNAQAECFLPLPKDLTPTEYTNVINEVYANTSTSDFCAGCVCNSLLIVAPDLFTKSVNVAFAGWTATYGVGGFCTAPAKNIATFYALQIISVLVVVMINFFAKFVMIALAKFEKHHLQSHQQASTAISIFAIQFFNMGLIVLVVFGDIQRIQDSVANAAQGVSAVSGSQVLNQATRLFPIFAGPFTDITSGWYAVVGTSLMLTILINVIIPVVPLILVPFKRCLLRMKIKKMVTQEDMNEAVLGPPFAIAERYGLILSTLFVCFMYSSGMPVMLLMASLTFFVIFWVEKFLLLRVYRLPPRYDGTMDRRVLSAMPWAGLLHLLFGLWTFSAEGTFPRPAVSSYITEYSSQYLGTADADADSFLVTFDVVDRLFNWVVLPMFILFLLVALPLIIPKILFFLSVFSCQCRGNKIAPVDDITYSSRLQRDGGMAGVTSYDMSKNTDYYGVNEANKQWPEVPENPI